MDIQNSTATTQQIDGDLNAVQFIAKSGESPVIESSSTLVELIDSIQVWGIQRNITKAGGATGLSQIKKLKKELDELDSGLQLNDRHEIIDGIGDMLVVLVQIARLEGFTWDECLAQAWGDIKDRKGNMCCGIFVKEADLNLPGLVEALEECKTAQEVEDAIDTAKERALNKGL